MDKYEVVLTDGTTIKLEANSMKFYEGDETIKFYNKNDSIFAFFNVDYVAGLINRSEEDNNDHT